MQVDAIVNTTNEEMIGYSGVDLAIHRAAGPRLNEECAALAPLGLGEAKLSGGYALPCRYIIHTSGPMWCGGGAGECELLRSCYLECLKLAVESGCHSVAFPLISAGVYGFPKDMVLRFAIQTITEFLFSHELCVYLCVFDRESYSFSQRLFEDIKSFIDDADTETCADDFLDEDEADALLAARELLPPTRERSFRYAEEEFCESRDISDCLDAGSSLREYMAHMDKSFQQMLFDLIDESGMTDVECYKRANVDKRTFSKIKSNRDYKPSKQTAIAFAISLHLDMETTQALLATAGFTLSKSKVFDRIIRYFIHKGIYDIFVINEALFEFDQVLLGV